MFFGYSKKDQLSVFGKTVTIKKGTVLYRIRKDDEVTDFNCPQAWEPPPSNLITKQGRFNEVGERILYVSTADSITVLEREASLNDGDIYYLAKYICKNDFEVATTLKNNDIINAFLHKIALALPVDNNLTFEENELLKQYIDFSKCECVQDYFNSLLSPYYLHKQIPDLYKITNKIKNLLLSYNSNGIRYTSSYFPAELSGTDKCITINGEENGNIALTLTGMKNIEFIGAEKRTYIKNDSLLTFISVFGEEDNERGENNDKT